MTLRPDAAQALRDTVTTATADSPDVLPQVKAQIRAGKLRRSPALEASFAEVRYGTTVYLVGGTDTVVLVALGE